MEEQLVSYETAILAKEKGFSAVLKTHYNLSGYIDDIRFNYDRSSIGYLAPTQSLLQKWLREVHNIDILIEPIGIDTLRRYGSNILSNKFEEVLNYSEDYEPKDIFNTYEEALEDCLTDALNLI